MKLAAPFFLIFTPLALGQGTVIPGAGGSNASLSVNVTRSATEEYSGSQVDSTDINGIYIASINGPEILDGSGQPLLQLDGYVTGRRYVVRDENSMKTTCPHPKNSITGVQNSPKFNGLKALATVSDSLLRGSSHQGRTKVKMMTERAHNQR